MGRDGMVLSKRTHTDGELLLHDTKPDGGYGAPDQGGHTAPPSPAPDTPTKPLLPPPEPSAAAPRSRGRLVRQFLEVTRPFFSVENPRRATAALWLGASVLLLVGESLCLVWFSYAQKELTTSMAERSREGFWRAVHSYLLIVLVACPLMALAEFCEERFVLLWRQWLTGHCMERYWQGRCFYTLGRDGAIDHPDQRICEDVANFTNRACGLLLKVAARAGNVVSFVAVLWAVSPPLVAFLLAYCAATTLLVTLGLGERLERLEVDRRVAEAGFRCGMMRGLEHSEEIAFYNAGGLERKGCDAKFAAVVAIARRLISVGLLLHLLQYTIEYVTILLPYLFVADRYFSGEMEFGVLSQTAMAFRVIQNGLTVVVRTLAGFSALAAETERIHALLDTLRTEASKEAAGVVRLPAGATLSADAAKGRPGEILRVERTDPGAPADAAKTPPPLLTLHDLTVLTPDRSSALWRQLTAAVGPGESLLIVGPSGCGKSSLLRAIAGLFTAGAGRVELPSSERLFFLPQKPYVPAGSLRSQLLYGNALPVAPPLRELEGHLKAVGLGMLPGRVGGWDEEGAALAGMLSLGEQQRLAVARLMAAGPSVAFLDECTSALDEHNEARMYAMMAAAVPCLVSVGHRRSLIPFHTRVLRCLGDGAWDLQAAADYPASPL